MSNNPDAQHTDPPNNLDLPQLTVLQMFSNNVRTSPESPSLHYFGRTLNHDEVDQMSNAVANRLFRIGVRAGDRVAISLQNTPPFVIVLLATWKIGAIGVPVNPMLRPHELEPMLADSGSKAIFAHPQMREIIDETLDHLDHSVSPFYSNAADLSGGCELPFAEMSTLIPDDQISFSDVVKDEDWTSNVDWCPPKLSDIALLTYTSGTTGPSKGAMNTHANLTYQSVACNQLFGLTKGDSVLTVAPLFHITGLGIHLALALGNDYPMVMTYRFHPETVLSLISKYRPKSTIGAITAFISLADASKESELASVAVTFSGGAAVPATVVERYEKQTGVYIHNAYGLTETTSACIAVPRYSRAPVDTRTGALSIGIPMIGTSVSIVSDDGYPLPPNTEGEIVVSGPQVCAGYWNNPDETARTFRPTGVYTGDIGMISDEGWVFVVDRKKDLVIVSGYKVWPRDVEDVLYLHPAIMEAAVVGMPHDYRGETLYAYVSLRPGATAEADELKEHCRKHLSAYKCPSVFVFLDDLPKTATGKILRRTLRDGLSNGG